MRLSAAAAAPPASPSSSSPYSEQRHKPQVTTVTPVAGVGAEGRCKLTFQRGVWRLVCEVEPPGPRAACIMCNCKAEM